MVTKFSYNLIDSNLSFANGLLHFIVSNWIFTSKFKYYSTSALVTVEGDGRLLLSHMYKKVPECGRFNQNFLQYFYGKKGTLREPHISHHIQRSHYWSAKQRVSANRLIFHSLINTFWKLKNTQYWLRELGRPGKIFHRNL